MADDLTHLEKSVLLRFYIAKDGPIFRARETIAREFGIDEITAACVIAKLERLGYIAEVRKH